MEPLTVQDIDAPLDGYAAARRAAALFDFSNRSLVRLTGEDRVSFLNGMVTNDVRRMPDGGALYAAMVNPKGAMISDARILKRPGDLLLDLEPGYADAVRAFLEKYIVSEDVEVSDATAELAVLRLIGPAAEGAAKAAWGAHIRLPSAGECVEVEGMWLTRTPPWGERCLDVFVPRARLGEIEKELLHRAAPVGLKRAGLDAFEIFRIEEGVPRFGQDMDERTIPLEANLQAAINYEKGCYIGQEVIARATFRGHVNKKLAGLILGQELPPPRAELRYGGKGVGWITSATVSPRIGCAIAIGYVHREYVEPGTRLEVAGYQGDAQVQKLPFEGPR